uniref:major facilitator superfamily domain-containing protein 1 isoform X10 n=1 Tax=Agelaius phoeniceus TaxID=39638 RepID=UPI0023EA82B8|nr:major facilitator superfamily domain-containing protein 1 isoform X10 [Agelaius phoeniceus]
MAEEQRALLGAEGGDGSHGSPGPPRALPAACDPRRLPHRLLVLALMCFLGFGAGRARGLRVAGGVGVWGPGHSPEASPSPRRQLLLLRQPGRSADAGSAETAVSAWLLLNAHSGMFFPLPLCCAGHEGEHSPVHGPLCLVLVAQRGAVLLWRLPDRQSVWDPVGHCNIQHLCVCWAGGFCSGSTVQYLLADGSGQVHIWGSTVNMNIMGWIYSRVQDLLGSAGPSTLGLALLIGGVTCLFSLSCALILAYLDRRAEKLLCKEQGKTGEVIKLTDVKDFSLSLWLIFVICVCYYAAVFPFIGLGKVFFIEKFRFSPQEASAINSIVYIISAPMSPVFGLLVDKVGKNIIWVLCAVVTTLASHIMLAFTFWNPWIAMHAVHPEPGPGSDCHSSWHDPGHQGIPVPGGLLQCLCVLVSASCGHAVLCQSPHRAEEQERLRRQNEDDLAKLLPKADAFSLRNKYLSKLGAQLPAHYSSCFSTLAHRSVLK